MNASILALRDGQLSNGEKRILVKLAHALRLQEDEPKRITMLFYLERRTRSVEMD